MAKKKSYEDLVNRLNEILDLIDDNIQLDEAVKLYKEGMDLIIKCNKYLSDYETEISELHGAALESFELTKFE